MASLPAVNDASGAGDERADDGAGRWTGPPTSQDHFFEPDGEAGPAETEEGEGGGTGSLEEGDSDFAWSSDEIDPIDDPVDLCERGVSIELLLDLLGDHDLGSKSTREVIAGFVLPQTADYGCSLAGLMKRSFPDTVGRATHYVVHPWDASFGRLVQTLASVDSAYRAATNGAKAMFWLDVFAIDQHLHFEGYTDPDRLWLHRDELLQNVRLCIETIPCTCLFMEPAHSPTLLQRSWCLYECMQALNYSSEVLLSPCPDADPDEPLGGVRPATGRMRCALDDFQGTVEAFSPRFEQSQTYSPQDREWLMTAVTAAHPSGTRWLNEQVGSVMARWLCQEVLSEIYQSGVLPPARSLHELGALLESLSCVDQANDQYLNALELLRDQLGVEHSSTLAVSHDLACLQAKHLFLFEQAEELLWATLRGREAIFGQRHDTTNETVLALARLLQALSRTEEAEALFRRALEHSLVDHGFGHPQTLLAANLLALLLQEKGSLQDAYILLSRTVDEGMRTLGPKHPDVLVWRNNMAVLLQDARDLRHAESLFRRTLTDSEQALGPDHPHTLNVVYNLGQCLWQQRKLRAAEMLFRRELVGCQGLLGYHHRDTLRSIRNMIEFLCSQGRDAEAHEYSEILADLGELDRTVDGDESAGDVDDEHAEAASDDDGLDCEEGLGQLARSQPDATLALGVGDASAQRRSTDAVALPETSSAASCSDPNAARVGRVDSELFVNREQTGSLGSDDDVVAGCSSMVTKFQSRPGSVGGGEQRTATPSDDRQATDHADVPREVGSSPSGLST